MMNKMRKAWNFNININLLAYMGYKFSVAAKLRGPGFYLRGQYLLQSTGKMLKLNNRSRKTTLC